MEGLITRINNNVAHQEQMAKQSQANLDQHREQLHQKYLESKKKSDARFDAILQRISKNTLKRAHHEKEGVDSEDRDEVMEQDEETKKNTVKEIQNTELTDEHREEDLGAGVEVRKETEECPEDVVVAVENDISMTFAVGDQDSFVEVVEKEEECVNSIRVINEKTVEGALKVVSENVDEKDERDVLTDLEVADLRSKVQMLARKSQATVYLDFGKKRKKKRRAKMRKSTRRSNTLPTRFPVAPILTGGHKGEESSAQVRLWWLRNWRKRQREKSTVRYGDGERKSCGRIKSQEHHAVGVGSCGGSTGEGTGGGDNEVGGGQRSACFILGGMIEHSRANEQGLFIVVGEGGKFAFASCLTAVIIRARGTELKSPNHDKTADVMHYNFSPILGPLFLIQQLQARPAHILHSTFSPGPHIILRVLARLTFFPP